MADLKFFYKENSGSEETKEVHVSKRFKDENGMEILWEIRKITAKEERKISKSVTTEKKDRATGTITEQHDDGEYMKRMAAAAVVSPNLADADLQKSYSDKYHKIRDKSDLLSTMLTVGELLSLFQQVMEFSDVVVDSGEVISTMDDEVEFVKN